MTTEAEVRSKWKTKVFDDATIQALTTKAHAFIVTDVSEKEVTQLLFNKKINFFEYLVSCTERSITAGQENRRQYEFRVDVRYTVQKDVSGANFNAVADGISAIRNKANSALGTDWDEIIDYTGLEVAASPIAEETIGGIKCWRQSIGFTGFKEQVFS